MRNKRLAKILAMLTLAIAAVIALPVPAWAAQASTTENGSYYDFTLDGGVTFCLEHNKGFPSNTPYEDQPVVITSSNASDLPTYIRSLDPSGDSAAVLSNLGKAFYYTQGDGKSDMKVWAQAQNLDDSDQTFKYALQLLIWHYGGSGGADLSQNDAPSKIANEIANNKTAPEGLQTTITLYTPAGEAGGGSSMDPMNKQNLGTISVTVAPTGPTVKTKASVNEVEAAPNQQVTDTVTMTNLTPDTTYVLNARLVQKDDPDTVVATGTKEFTANSADATETVELAKFDATGLENKELVIFEELRVKDGDVVATHTDPDDADQTVTVKPVTPDEPGDDTPDTPGDDTPDTPDTPTDGGGETPETPSDKPQPKPTPKPTPSRTPVSGKGTPATGDASPLVSIAVAALTGIMTMAAGIVRRSRESR